MLTFEYHCDGSYWWSLMYVLSILFTSFSKLNSIQISIILLYISKLFYSQNPDQETPHEIQLKILRKGDKHNRLTLVPVLLTCVYTWSKVELPYWLLWWHGIHSHKTLIEYMYLSTYIVSCYMTIHVHVASYVSNFNPSCDI